MKSISQSYNGGEPTLVEMPAPALRPGGVLVRTAASLVSAGTERAMVELAGKSLIGKAKARPDLVRQVVEKVRRDGVVATAQTVRRRLDVPIPLGYSSAGTVIAVGEGVDGLAVGDRVACAGAGFANHAELVFVPKNLVAKLPDSVDFEAGAYTTVGAIGLEGLRLAQPQLGETVAVIGLGLIGLLVVQLARAAGCRVVGTDLDPARCTLAEQLGCDVATADLEAFAETIAVLSNGIGADAVLITASTSSSGPVRLAGEVARKRGRVVVVGAVGLELPRKPYYDKEIEFRVSCSYGPGRHDPDYEIKGRDYPPGFARWTEQRNLAAFVEQLARGAVQVAPLTSHRFSIDDAEQAYELLTGGGEAVLGIVLEYPRREDESAVLTSSIGTVAAGPNAGVRLGVLGAGLFATGTLLPALKEIAGCELVALATGTGMSAKHSGDKFGFQMVGTDDAELIGHDGIDALVVATRHDQHAAQVLAGIAAGKALFVEKPLCLKESELDEIEAALASAERPMVMVGFNRRFAPLAVSLKQAFAGRSEALAVDYRVNAGFIPGEHWTQDSEVGGGRLLGEVCHFVDFIRWLVDSPIRRVRAVALPDAGRYCQDNLVLTLEMADGSIGTLRYLASGDKGMSKEQIEVFGSSKAAVLDNFRRLVVHGGGKRRVESSRFGQDKGHRAELEAFIAGVKSGVEPVPIAESIEAMRVCFAALRSLREGQAIDLT